MALAERIRSAINAYVSEVEPLARVGRISVSIGVAAQIPDALDPDERSELLLAQADSALYSAKYSGRNRVCLALEKQAMQEPGIGPILQSVRPG